MDLKKFKKLEKEIKKQDFANSYKGINKLLRVLSYLGNVGSIFLASFFISKLIGESVTVLENSPIATWVITLVLLGSLELLKRDIFDKFSLEFLRFRSVLKKEVAILTLFSLMLISMSFYSSLNGAQEFSSKNEVIENKMEQDVTAYTDSLTNVYQLEIDELEDEIKGYKVKIDEKDEEQAIINESLQERGYLYRSEKSRNNQLTEEKEKLESKIDENEAEIDELELERDTKISEYEEEQSSKVSEEQGENKSNSIIFVVISTIIEFLILIGIFFNKNYSFRSYNDYKKKMSNNPKYQKWIFYNHVLDVMYMDDGAVNDKLPSNKNIYDFCRMNDVLCNEKNVSDCMKLFKALKIIKASGPNKYINKEKEEALEILKKNLKLND